MFKHTPGPWRVKTGTYFNNEAEGDMSLREYKWVGAGQIGDEWPVLSKHLPENEANARLISAAPEMLQALERAVETYANTCSCDECSACIERQRFEALIAKATGGAK